MTTRDALRVADRDRAIAAVRELLEAVGEDAERLGLLRTPERVADLYLDLFSGSASTPRRRSEFPSHSPRTTTR